MARARKRKAEFNPLDVYENRTKTAKPKQDAEAVRQLAWKQLAAPKKIAWRTRWQSTEAVVDPDERKKREESLRIGWAAEVVKIIKAAGLPLVAMTEAAANPDGIRLQCLGERGAARFESMCANGGPS